MKKFSSLGRLTTFQVRRSLMQPAARSLVGLHRYGTFPAQLKVHLDIAASEFYTFN